MLRSRSLLLFGLLALLVGPVQAQSESDTTDVAFRVQMPDSVVVTASRVAATAQKTGRRVSVYTRQDIRNLAVNSVDQLLDQVTGLDVQSRGGFGVQSDLTMRGSTFNGVLLLLDGARINDPYTGHFLMDLPVPLSEIARVEVLHGPATALYGPDALGGVVHLITETASRTGSASKQGVSVTAEGRYGGNDLYDTGGSVRHASENTTTSVAATFQGSDGQTVRPPSAPDLANTVRTDFNRRTATAAVTSRVGGASLYTRAGVDDREFGAYQFYTNFSTDRAREATSTFWVQSRLASAENTDTPWQIQLSGKQHRDRYTYNSTAPDRKHISRRLNVQGQIARTLGSFVVTGGASGGLRGLDSNRDGLHSDPSVGAFVSTRWDATSRLTLNQSVRIDYDPVYGVEPTPQLYLAYDLGVATLRAGGGRVVRAPNYLERFIDSATNQGNPNLDAETAWSGEVGGEVRLPAGLSFSVTGFGRTTQNSIDYLRQGFVFEARNLDRTTTTGLETEMRLHRQLSSAVGLNLNAAYTRLNPVYDTEESPDDYKYALTSARHLVQGSASVSVSDLSLGIQSVWKDRFGDSATSQYGVVHARLAYNTRLGGARTTFSTEVRNVGDREYTEIFGAPMPKRTLLVGAKVQL